MASTFFTRVAVLVIGRVFVVTGTSFDIMVVMFTIVVTMCSGRLCLFSILGQLSQCWCIVVSRQQEAVRVVIFVILFNRFAVFAADVLVWVRNASAVVVNARTLCAFVVILCTTSAFIHYCWSDVFVVVGVMFG